MEFSSVLKALAAADVDYVVVGGVAAVLQGVPTNTFDLDLVHGREFENRQRLAGVLKELNACYREHLPGKRLEPRVEDLATEGHHLLHTDAGPIDLLGAIVGGRDYEQLVRTSIEMEVGGCAVRVVDLPTLIDIKAEMGRDKDLVQLNVLRHTLAERRGQD
jgi:hypothetical protein